MTTTPKYCSDIQRRDFLSLIEGQRWWWGGISVCDRPLALIFPAPNFTTRFSIMPKDPTERREKKEKKEKREKKKKEVVEEVPAEAPTTDAPDDVEMDDNVEETKVYFSHSRLDFVSIDRSHAHQQQVTKKPKREKKEKKDEVVVPVEDLSPIAHPLAQRKLLKKLNKTVKKGMNSFVFFPEPLTDAGALASRARQVKRGVKEVVKGIRKGEKG